METTTKYVGLDVHKDTTVIAVAESGRDGEVRPYGEISSDLGALEKVLRQLGGEGSTLHVVYEAGPTGFLLYRRLQQLQIDCVVVAPTKTPLEKGPRQKTDRRDALMLARPHRAGKLTAIHVPDAVDESIRDLTRARIDAVHDLTMSPASSSTHAVCRRSPKSSPTVSWLVFIRRSIILPPSHFYWLNQAAARRWGVRARGEAGRMGWTGGSVAGAWRERGGGQGCGGMPISKTTGGASVHASTARGARQSHAADPESVGRFQETLRLRSFAATTQSEYLRLVRRLAAHHGGDPATVEEAQVRRSTDAQTEKPLRRRMQQVVARPADSAWAVTAAEKRATCASPPLRGQHNPHNPRSTWRRHSRGACSTRVPLRATAQQNALS